jgi:hypothetical protein
MRSQEVPTSHGRNRVVTQWREFSVKKNAISFFLQHEHFMYAHCTRFSIFVLSCEWDEDDDVQL